MVHRDGACTIFIAIDCLLQLTLTRYSEYFNNVFPKVLTADIDAFEVKYKCSDEENADVLNYYTQFKGDLNKMLECVMLSSDIDKDRWVKDYITPAIERGDVEDYTDKIQKTLGSIPAKKKKSKGSAGKRKMEEEYDYYSDGGSGSEDSGIPMAEIVEEGDEVEAKEEDRPSPKENSKSSNKAKSKAKEANSSSTNAAKPSKKKKSSAGNDKDDLIAQIRGNAVARRQGGFDSLMAGLEEKYASGGKKKRKKQTLDEDDIDDEEFAKIQAKLMKKKKK